MPKLFYKNTLIQAWTPVNLATVWHINWQLKWPINFTVTKMWTVHIARLYPQISNTLQFFFEGVGS